MQTHAVRSSATLALIMAVFTVAGAAPAQSRAEVDKARALALKAADDLDAKRYAEAIEGAEKAEALYHAPTHLLILAEATEGLGRLADALVIYERLTAEPLPRGAPRAFQKARAQGEKRLGALIARVPSLLLTVRGPAASVAKATLNGRPFSSEASEATRLDPGTYELRVEAEGYSPSTRTITLPEKGGVVEIEIELRANARKDGLEADQAASQKGSLVPGIAALGIGAAGLVTGAVTGVLSLNRVAALRDVCPSGRCTPAEQPIIDEAGLFGTISTVGFAVGGAGVAAGVILLLVRGSSGEKKAAHRDDRLDVWVGIGSAGMKGRF